MLYEAADENPWNQRRLEDVLYSDNDALTKVVQIMQLGYDEEVASEMVERYQVGQYAPVYYERLDFDQEEDRQ